MSGSGKALVVALALSTHMFLNTSAHATEATAEGDDSMPWVARAGADAGKDSSRGATLSLDYVGVGHLHPEFGVSGLHSDAPVSDTTATSTTKVVDAHAGYGSDLIKGGLAFESTSQEGLRTSKRWTGTVNLSGGGFSAGLSVSTRSTDFDSFSATWPTTLLGQTIVTTASCSVNDRGYGLSLGYGTDSWSAYLTGNTYDYDDVECDFATNLPAALHRLNHGAFQQYAGAFLARATARTGGRLGQESGLLSNSVGAGLVEYWNRFGLAFDYLRTTDEFGGANVDNYTMTGTLHITAHVATDLAVGTTVSDSDTAPYAGLYLSVFW